MPFHRGKAMNLTLNVPEEVARQLEQLAAAPGQDVNTFVQDTAENLRRVYQLIRELDNSEGK